LRGMQPFKDIGVCGLEQAADLLVERMLLMSYDGHEVASIRSLDRSDLIAIHSLQKKMRMVRPSAASL
jgi:hypothetical protein